MGGLRWAAGFILLALLAGSPALADQWVRPAGLAGTWYPADASELKSSINRFLAQAKTQDLPPVVALVTPHAGHKYSGAVAGQAWAIARSMKPRPSLVVLLGPSHRMRLTRPSIWPRGSYDSPLGPVAIDQALAAELTKALGAEFVRQAHLAEHCLEVQLPFMRQALPQAKLVPILMGSAGPEEIRRMGRALARVLRGKPVLIVVSCDLSHFHSLAEARRLDGQVGRRLTALDPEGLLADAVAGRCEACGIIPLTVAMHAARQLGATRGQVLAADTSASVTGDTARVVGYMAAALVKGQPTAARTSPGFSLSAAQKKRLRNLARAAVVAAVRGQPLPQAPSDDPKLASPPGRVFVTLKKHGQLRGCLGHLGDNLGLAQAVIRMAAASALDDPRFPPVRPEELADLELEVSVLTPFRPCRAGEVRVGVHGLIMTRGLRRGLLLPQVPGPLGWDREQFLANTCRKAGLPPGCWQDPHTRLECFQALVF